MTLLHDFYEYIYLIIPPSLLLPRSSLPLFVLPSERFLSLAVCSLDAHRDFVKARVECDMPARSMLAKPILEDIE